MGYLLGTGLIAAHRNSKVRNFSRTLFSGRSSAKWGSRASVFENSRARIHVVIL